MCQVNSVWTRKEKIRGYRIYKIVPDNIEVSYYDRNLRPKLGKVIEATEDPFHVFIGIPSLKKWAAYQVYYPDEEGNCNLVNFRIYLAELSGKIFTGVWGDIETVKTATGTRCTLIKDITKEMLPRIGL
ncbi:MAG: hypothetical protein NTZ48_05585 [Candidatus Omnitrophica bacterium]|nr:hypothetical protein [Candidatus Omnitrophota bacterium]